MRVMRSKYIVFLVIIEALMSTTVTAVDGRIRGNAEPGADALDVGITVESSITTARMQLGFYFLWALRRLRIVLLKSKSFLDFY